MNQTKKRNIIIGALCGVLLLMVVGYAAFSSVLNITGTSKISSNWDIKITDIQTKNVVGGATNAEDPTGIGTLNAAFKTNLVSPGDSIEYHITIKNGGTLNAKLDKITLSEPNNDIITFTASGLTEGEGLDAGVSKVLTVKVEYKDIPEGQEQPSSTTGTLTVKLDFSQGEGGGTVSPGGETAASKLISTVVTSGDGLYEDTTEDGRYIYKGTTPNNYITFNNEEKPWRIMSVESDNTIKIIREESIGNIVWDEKYNRTSSGNKYCINLPEYGCNAWAATSNLVNTPSVFTLYEPNGNPNTYSYSYSGTVTQDTSINTYLNTTYYNGLTEEVKDYIVNHNFNIGTPGNFSDTEDIATNITQEALYKWNGKIGLMNVSDIMKTTTQTGCTSLKVANNNNSKSICSDNNWMWPKSGTIWTISPVVGSSCNNVYIVKSDNYISSGIAIATYIGVLPTLYLSPEIQLEGDGTYSNPYTIVSK